MASSKSKAELQREIRTLKSQRFYDNWAVIGSRAVKWGAIAFIAWQARLAIEALAGRTTVASLAAALVKPDGGKDEIIPWGLAAMFGLYGLRQRAIRRKLTKRLAGDRQAKEKALDPKRSSSNLTASGETPDEELIP